MIRYVYLNLPQRPGRRRWMELQCRLHHLGARRIEALRPNEGRVILPDSRLELGELGINATWVTLLQKLADDSPRDDHEWLVILEDDALLVPRFRRSVERVLAQAPRTCSLVQLAHLLPGSWRPDPRLLVKVSRKARSTARRLRAHIRPRNEPKGGFSPSMQWGAHIVAVRVADAHQVTAVLLDEDDATDAAFRAFATKHPGALLCYQGQLGYQMPFGSDLVHARYIRSAGRSRGPSVREYLRYHIANAAGRGRGEPGPGGP